MASWCAGYGRGGPPIVCVHGAGVSSRELLPLVERLGEHAEIWTVDLPGFGHSDKPPHVLGLPALGDAVADWITARGLAPVCLLGGSFGCQIAVDVAVRHPELVAGLVLVGPTIDPSGRTWPRIVARWLRNSVHEEPSMARLNLADYRDCGLRRMIATFNESRRDRVEDRLPHVRAPALVVRGERDAMVPAAWAEQVTRLLPYGRLVTVGGSPHMIPYKDPDALVGPITGFVRRVREEASAFQEA